MQGINGLETIIYGVDDMDASTRFFEDFGLPRILDCPDGEARFELAEGSTIIIRPIDKAQVPGQTLVGIGVQQLIWGVSSQKHIDRLVKRLQNKGVDVRFEDDGTPRFFDFNGIYIGLRVYDRKVIPGAPDPINSLGSINRINVHRKWRARAYPKTLEHIVFAVPDTKGAFEWYRDMLDFRLSDIQDGMGYFCRAPGHYAHHHIFFIGADLKFLGHDGKVRFHHCMFGVEDLDEIMVGANYMERRGWPKSKWGVGRHRIGSGLHYYIDNPAGGEAEYGADMDCYDDSWMPKLWNPSFALMSFVHNMQPFQFPFPPWEVNYVEDYIPRDVPSDHPAQPVRKSEADS